MLLLLLLLLLLTPGCRFQAASQKLGRAMAGSKGAGSRELKERVEQYETSKVEVQPPRQVRSSSSSSSDDRVEKAAQQLQEATTELADLLQANGARASPAAIKAMEGSMAVITQLLSGGW